MAGMVSETLSVSGLPESSFSPIVLVSECSSRSARDNLCLTQAGKSNDTAIASRFYGHDGAAPDTGPCSGPIG